MPLVHHVGLIVEATGDRDVDNAAGRVQEQAAGMLESNNPRGRLGRDAELGDEALAEVATAETDVACELVTVDPRPKRCGHA